MLSYATFVSLMILPIIGWNNSMEIAQEIKGLAVLAGLAWSAMQADRR